MLIAYILDLIIGDPLWFPHPVIYIGKWIKWFEKYYRDSYFRGIILLISTLLVTLLTVHLLVQLGELLPYNVVIPFLLWTSLATKSLIKAANLVVRQTTIEEKRKYLSYIVSRNTNNLNEHEVNKAVVETVAENTIDGIVSPLFYIFIGYLIGYPVEIVFAFKAISTLDSMVGYKNDRFYKYGYASAKADDIMNFIPARLGSVLMGVVGLFSGNNGFKVFFKDRKKHDSPNAGHPESMMAGILNIQLGGPSTYSGLLKNKPWLGSNKREINKQDVYHSMRISLSTSILTLGVMIWIMVYMGQIQNVL